MKINKNKIRATECSIKKSGHAEGIGFGNETVKVVDEFTYLESEITNFSCNTKDIKFRMAREEKGF